MKTAIYLTFKEIWRNRGRFLLFSLVIALITVLVLFISALADGLGSGNREYIEKLNGELVVYKANVDLSIGASKLGRAQAARVRRVKGVNDAGQVSFASVTAIYGNGKKLNVALIGVEGGKPGEPPVVQGRGLRDRTKEALIDRNTTLRTGLKAGDDIVLKTIQGTKEEFYTLRVVGVMDGRQYSLQPAVVVGDLAFDKIKPGAVSVAQTDDFVSNIIVVQLENPDDGKTMAAKIAVEVDEVQAVDRKTAYENTPGYSAQQSTLSTQQFFSLLVGILVIGGFFQIQTLQKVPQIGMLKAIGAPTSTIAIAAVIQIFVVTLVGVAIGTTVTILMALALPATIPIAFSPSAILLGIVSLMTIGPVGGLISVRYAVRVEPLSALGLSG